MTQRARLALATMLLAVLVVVAYAPVERGVFVWDDQTLVSANRALAKQPLTRVFTLPFWTNDPSMDARPTYYRPIVMLSYRADLALDEDNEASFHITNLILHVLATSLLVAVAWRLGASVTASLLAAALWALAPRLTESVAWVSGRTDVLAAIFVFASILAWPWLPAPNRPNAPRAPPARETPRAIVASIFLLLAFLSKEVAIAGVAALALGTWLASRKEQRRPLALTARRTAFLAGTVVAYFVLRSHAMAAVQARAPLALGATTRASTFLEAVGRYAAMIADPFHPASSIGAIGDPSVPHAVAGALVIVVVAVLFVRALGARDHDAPGALVGAALAIAALAPVVHVFPLGISSAVAADRLLYLPLAGLALAGAVAADRLRGRVAISAAVVAGALAVSFVPFVSARAADYTDELRFRLAAIDHADPRNTAPLSGLATVLRAYREHELACRLHDQVRVRLEASGRAATTRHTRAVENVAACFALYGDYERASEVYESIAKENPGSARIRMEIGYLALHRLDFAKAEADLQQAVRLDPSLDAARALLEQLPEVHAELQRLATPEARIGDPRAWAVLMARLGRRSDTIAAWVAIVGDPHRPFADVTHGVLFLLEEADYDTAMRAVATWEKRANADDVRVMKQYVRRRTKTHESFLAARSRIEALLAP